MFTDPAQPNLPRTASDQTPPACDQDERTDDPILVEERRHLSETYAKLEAMEQALVAKIQKLDDDVAADKEMLADELTGNFASMGEAFETYAEFASANKTIDLYNAAQELNFQNLQKVRLLMHQPYFAKVALQFKPGDAPKELYIGNAGISDDNYKRLVVDWRSPVAEVYYNQENGPTSYKANGRTINVDLELRRQFDIEADRLNAYFDTTVAIQDAMLLASLSQERSSHMRAITATIQKEQNEVIRHEDVDALLVNGIAGSGKTSVLMQRIAYLFYQHRETLKPEEVCLITPNPVFSRYIEQVLPDLGESNPETMTFDQFMASVMPAERSRGRADISPDALARIDEAVRGLAFDPNDFKDIVCDGTQLISAGQIRQAADKFHRIPAGPHLVTLMREELHKRLENRLRQMAATERAQNEATSLSVQEQVRIFHETIAPQTDAELRECTLTYLHDRYAAAFDIVERDEWLRIDRIGMRILGAEGLLPVEWVYLKMAVSGMGDASVKYVMVDEVQDYTCAQLMVLRRYFRRARFLLLGDENQAIKDHTASFAEIKSVFEQAGAGMPPPDELPLVSADHGAVHEAHAERRPHARLVGAARARRTVHRILRRRGRLRRRPARRRRAGARHGRPDRRDRRQPRIAQARPIHPGRKRARRDFRRRHASRERRRAHDARVRQGPRVRPGDHSRRPRRGVRRRTRGTQSPVHEHLARHGTHRHPCARRADAFARLAKDRIHAPRSVPERGAFSFPHRPRCPEVDVFGTQESPTGYPSRFVSIF